MASEQLWQRSELMGTQVITRDTGRRLGVVAEILVDVDRREVVALGLRDNILSKVVPGVPRYMYLAKICQVGDVVLVDSDDAIEDVDLRPYSALINSEVITESGQPLGRVRGFQFNIENGTLQSLVIASIGLAFVPEGVISTYELPIDEIVSSGPDRIIVFEGSEDRLQQLSVGFLERLGIGSPPWEKDDDAYVLPTIPAENQLPSGLPTQPQQTYGQKNYGQKNYEGQPTRNDPAWDEDTWEREPEAIPREQPREEPKRRYLEAEPDEWTDVSTRSNDYSSSDPTDSGSRRPRDAAGGFAGDVWEDAQQPAPKKLEMPESLPEKQPEYEDGGY